tara:strand:- start:927 stop:2183 length:1257 start_codon:yes stop_codon:yes gene_type:complete
MKKILVISYYWPPSGGGGVQRITKFCKYLSEFGWEPYVITAPKQKFISIDDSFLKDVKNLKVFHTSQPKESKKTTIKNISKSKLKVYFNWLKSFIRVNFMIPDSKIFWYFSALKIGKQLLKTESFDIIFSTSPPYTTQLVARKLKKLSKIKWVVDFRDPWVENIYYNNVYRFKFVKLINRILERNVLNDCDRIITIGDNLKQMLSHKTSNKIDVVHNGCDPIDFPENITKSDKFIIGYYGSLNEYQISKSFLKVIASFAVKNPKLYNDIEFHLSGTQTPDALRIIYGIIPNQKIINHGYLNHDVLTKILSREQLLLQLIHNQHDNQVIIGSKVYEYIYSGNPILCLSSKDTEAVDVITKSNAGVVFDYDDKTKIEQYILEQYNNWGNGKLNFGRRRIKEYMRFNQAKLLSDIFNEVID